MVVINGNGIDMGNNPISNVDIQNDVDVVDKEYVDFSTESTKEYVDNMSVLPIGTILSGYTIFDNCIVAFGGEFNRTDYPKLWTYLQANPTLVKTQAQWQTESTNNGGICGFFSDGNGTTTFRVPNLNKAFLRPDSRSIASFEVDMFKSHNHTVQGYIGDFFHYSGGGGMGGTGRPLQAQSSTAILNAGGAETRPKNIAVLPLIVAK